MSARILCGDVREVLPTLADGSVDVCVADPPYGETSLKWDRRVPGWPALVRRLLKPHGSLWVFGSLRCHLETRDDFADWHLAQDVIWEKHHGSGFGTDRFMRVHEQVAHYYAADWASVHKEVQFETVRPRKGRVVRSAPIGHRGKIGPHAGYEFSDKIMARSVIYCRSMHGRAVHETHKPPELIEPILRYSCPPGGTVLDLFAGSGATSAAALRCGRSAIGIELRPECAEIARRWVEGDAPLFNRAEVA